MESVGKGESSSGMIDNGDSSSRRSSLDDSRMTEDQIMFDENAHLSTSSSSFRSHRRVPGARFTCPCGFSLEVPGEEGVDLIMLNECLRRRVREHAALGCAGEPSFQVRRLFGIPTLVMGCMTCKSIFPVL